MAARVDSPSTVAVSIREAARLTGVGTAVLYRAVRAGQVPSIRIGNRVLIPRRWLNELAGVEVLGG